MNRRPHARDGRARDYRAPDYRAWDDRGSSWKGLEKALEFRCWPTDRGSSNWKVKGQKAWPLPAKKTHRSGILAGSLKF
jgi:hypothetical protein